MEDVSVIKKAAEMNAEHLLAHFDRIADAPDAIPRLRRFVLDLAVRGKLVPQDPNDEPASELLKRILTEKARLVKAGKTGKDKVLPTIKIDEVPFRIPGKWCWVRFGNIADFSAGRTPPRNEPSFWNTGDYPWISIADMNDSETLTATRETVSKASAKRIFRSDPQQVGTIIMSFKLTIGKIARLGIPAYHNEAIISIRLYVAHLDPYLFKVLPFFARQGNTKGAIKGETLNRESLSNLLFPLPPLAEQHRIVAKVDELMAFCDRLEAARVEREATRDRMATASLARLNAPDPDPATFQNHAAFALNNLTPLTTRPDQIKALRQTILNLAVDSEFFVKALRANADDGRLAEYFTGTGIKHFTGKGLAAYLFPLPPLAEQRRIVAKVDELMAVCDQLEESLTTGDNTRRHLLDALLHEALKSDEENRLTNYELTT